MGYSLDMSQKYNVTAKKAEMVSPLKEGILFRIILLYFTHLKSQLYSLLGANFLERDR